MIYFIFGLVIGTCAGVVITGLFAGGRGRDFEFDDELRAQDQKGGE